MKNLCLALVLSVFVATNGVASDIGKALAKSDVSHLELIANNLNVLAVMEKILKKMDQKEHKNNESRENVLTKFLVSKDSRLIIEDFYSAPVTSVTDEVCKEQLVKLQESVSGSDSKISVTLSMLSPTKLTTEQAQQILDDAHLVVHMHAKENSQLSLSCRK